MSDHATFTILEFKQLCVPSKIFSVITINILLLKIMILINQTQVWGAGVSHMHQQGCSIHSCHCLLNKNTLIKCLNVLFYSSILPNMWHKQLVFNIQMTRYWSKLFELFWRSLVIGLQDIHEQHQDAGPDVSAVMWKCSHFPRRLNMWWLALLPHRRKVVHLTSPSCHGLSVWSLHVSVWVLSGHSGSLPWSKDMQLVELGQLVNLNYP